MKPQLLALLTAISWGVGGYFEKKGLHMGNLSPQMGITIRTAVALLVLGIGLSLGGPTGYAINPARDLGPRIAHFILPIKNKRDSDWSYSWVPVIGPVLGGVLAAFVFKLLTT